MRTRLGSLIAALDAFAHREWRWIVTIAWLIICAYFINDKADAIHFLSLGDTDDNMRYLQVRDWLAGQSWWDLRQHRMNPPEGMNIHWSRLVDLPIAALMLFFRLFTSPERADQLAVGVEPLIPLLLLMFALAFLARRLAHEGRGHAWFVAMLLPLAAGMGLSMYMPLRVDHHGWQLALTAMTLAGLVDRKWTRGGIVAGVSSALSVIIGMEMLVYLAGAGALIALRWIFKDGAERRMRPYALALGGTTALGYALFASNVNRLPVCDAISPVWATVLILTAGILYGLTLLPLKGWLQRFIAAAMGGVFILGFAYATWPQCVMDVYQISPELQKRWLVYIREAKPIYAQARASWVPMIALPAAGLICAMAGCWASRRNSERLWAWVTVTLMIAFAVGLMFWQIRAGPAAQVLAIAPVAWATWAMAVKLIKGRYYQRGLAVLGIAILGCVANVYAVYPLAARTLENWSAKAPNASAAAPAKPVANTVATLAAPSNASVTNGATANQVATVKKVARKSEVRCRTMPALRPLDQLAPATIFTLVDLGPRLIALTHHTVIAGPYHRNPDAILAVQHAFDGPPERFLEIARAHGASYLLYCPNFPEGTIYQRRSPKGFYARLSRGETFPFLTPVELKFEGELPYMLYRIAPATTGSAPLGKKVTQQPR